MCGRWPAWWHHMTRLGLGIHASQDALPPPPPPVLVPLVTHRDDDVEPTRACLQYPRMVVRERSSAGVVGGGRIGLDRVGIIIDGSLARWRRRGCGWWTRQEAQANARGMGRGQGHSWRSGVAAAHRERGGLAAGTKWRRRTRCGAGRDAAQGELRRRVSCGAGRAGCWRE